MAAWLSRKALSGKSTWLLPSSHIFKSHVYCREVGRTSSAPGALSSLQDKPQTVEDLHRVTFLETLYRLVFQGYYNREHDLQGRKGAGGYLQQSMGEIQPGQVAVHCRATQRHTGQTTMHSLTHT
ncbi:hypothetical protein ILYODFUR_032960 [Ilyodon furcidens]|uniref:Uncharacterized protein n=1 Tax=Ilyodon furcidens TaxID=33524 RepID=A0ABV0TNT3_9TELE